MNQVTCRNHFAIDLDSGAALVSGSLCCCFGFCLIVVSTIPHHKYSIFFKGQSAQVTDWVEAR